MSYQRMEKIGLSILASAVFLVTLSGCGSAEKNSDSSHPYNAYYKDANLMYFGTYEQDNNTKNGPEPIQWEILDTNENGTLLLSCNVLEMCSFTDNPIMDNRSVTWENSDLRKWLNNDFYNEAFSAIEKQQINTVTLSNPTKPNRDKPCIEGVDTQDKVFCLSMDEIEKYFHCSATRDTGCAYYPDSIAGISEYLVRKDNEDGVSQLDTHVFSIDDLKNNDWGFDESVLGFRSGEWYTRSVTDDCEDQSIVRVSALGLTGWGFPGVRNPENGIRPAIYIKQ